MIVEIKGNNDNSKSFRATFPNLKPTTQSISLRLPLWMLESIKTTANRQDVPYQSLIKVWLNEKLEELHHGAKYWLRRST